MVGFLNGVLSATNIDFTGNSPVNGQITDEGQLLIGSLVGPEIKTGNLISSDNSILINYVDPDLDLIANIEETQPGYIEKYWKASDLDAVETDFAPLFQDDETNAKILVRAYDDTTEEFVNFSFKTNSDLATDESVTFRAFIYAETAATDNIQLRFGHNNMANDENWNVVYSNVDSGDFILSATQNNITIAEWSETVTNLGWSANELVNARLSRIAPTGTNLTGDLFLIGFSVQMRATATGGGTGGGGGIETLTGNAGGPVSPDGSGNIDFEGDVSQGFIFNQGTPGSNRLDLRLIEPSLDGKLLIGNTSLSEPKIGDLISTDGSLAISYDGTNLDLSVQDIPSGMTCVEVSVDTQMQNNVWYIVNSASDVVLTLPELSPFCSDIGVIHKGTGNVTIAQNTGQQIRFGELLSTQGTSGTLVSGGQGSTIKMKTITEDLLFIHIHSTRGWTVN